MKFVGKIKECLMKNLFLFTTLLNILANLHIIIGIKMTFSIIVAGYDEEKFGQIYAVTIGGYSIRQKIYITGSGSTFLYGYMDKNFKEGMTNEEAVELVKNAVCLAKRRDAMSGGCINLAIIDKNGTVHKTIRPDMPDHPKI
uniref:proteasome endopeptidase complex n=1 Tax=Meloidogyne enterolobii TaxID=390850 RepID=A0A6V7UXV7_MELEN|nr:unnamed protein product [Meloidogyne enterolobii]